MYLSFFALHERPFTITPDPRYLFMSERHAEALAHLIYGVTESDGFIVLTGEVGTGKTTLVRSLLQKMPAEADVALVLNPQLTAREFLSVILKELGIELPENAESNRALIEVLNDYLLNAHANARRTIVVVDEAQNLSVEVLEQIRLLTNLETARHKLLQIVLIGQPELREMLARQDLRQLAQRVTARYHLMPLNADEATRYVDHRLAVAGALQPIFTARAKKALFQIARGIPRLMNLVADRALLGAWSQESRNVTPSMVRAAAREVSGELAPATPRWRYAIAAAALLVLVIGAIALWPRDRPKALEQALAKPVDTRAAAQVSNSSASLLPAQAANPPLEISIPADATSDVLPDLGEWLMARRDKTGTRDAFATLFELWGQTLDSQAASACQQAVTHGLRCVADRGSLAILRQLNRPAIITLRNFNGEQHQVVLSSINAGALQLRLYEDSISVDAAQLEKLWFGEYLLLWRPPNDNLTSLREGMRNELVLWLRQSLTANQNVDAAPLDSTLFDAALVARVRDYQRSRRLTVDGLVGQRTQLMINSDLGIAATPLLTDVANNGEVSN